MTDDFTYYRRHLPHLGAPGATYFVTFKLAGSLPEARQANLLLNRQSAFWQEESYDHIVRDEEELGRIILYILNNPVKARLVEIWTDWKWNYLRGDLEVGLI